MWKPGQRFTPETFKVELLQMKGWQREWRDLERGSWVNGRPGCRFWQTHSCNLELSVAVSFFLFPPPHWKLFIQACLYPPQKNIPFFCVCVTNINGAISLKRLQSQIIHCNPPFEDLNASNWAFITHKLYLPLLFPPLFFLISSPSGICFSSFPPRCRVTLSLSPVGVLSCLTPVHIFTAPLSPSPHDTPRPSDNELLTEYIIRAVVLFVVVLASERKGWIINDDRRKKKKRGRMKWKYCIFRNVWLHQEAPPRQKVFHQDHYSFIDLLINSVTNM